MNDTSWDPSEIAEDAAEWFAVLETERPSEATRTVFVEWLIRSPVHIEEFLRVSALHSALSSELKANPDWLAEILTEVPGAGSNVVRMAGVDRVPVSRTRAGRPRHWVFWAAAAVLAVAVGIAGIVSLTGIFPLTSRVQTLATEVGEQRRVVLEDGSSVILNTDTELRVRMGRNQRRVELIRGEAIFDIEKDPDRPFRVVSDLAMVEAIGTRFVVHRQHRQTVVTVVEGRVLVEPMVGAEGEDSPPVVADPTVGLEPSGRISSTRVHRTERPVELGAGRQVTVAVGGTIAEPAAANVESAIAWTRGREIFDSDRLDEVVAVLNRYNKEQLVILDPTLSDRRISGIFNIDDPDAFLRLLSDLGEISVERDADGRRGIRHAPVSP
jgi:transmembrane sensor